VRFVDYGVIRFVCLALAVNHDVIAVAHNIAVTNKGAPFSLYGEASNAQRNISVHISKVMSCERVKHSDTGAVCTSEGNKRSTRYAFIARTENVSSC